MNGDDPSRRRRATGESPAATWDRQSSVVSSSGSFPKVEPSNEQPIPRAGSRARLPEDQARGILDRRFAAAGARLVHDHVFRHGDLCVTLDGYDPDRRWGYAYVSHGDADVVTDLDDAAELGLAELARSGEAFVLVIHDDDMPNIDVLERRIDAYFSSLPR